MPLLLVRHAVALRRHDWSKPDHRRPLTPKGYAQAESLVELLRPHGVTRILSSPFVRCVETVEPLALRLGLPLEPRDDLAEGAGTLAAARLSEAVEEGATVVVCSHGDVIPALLEILLASEAIGADGLRCAKGSTWVIERHAASATYLPPPDGP